MIKSYPRTIEETVRKEVRSRKEKRDAREERKKEEKAKVIEELNLLKNLKQKEILSKVEQLKKIAGKEEGAGADKMDEEYFDKVCFVFRVNSKRFRVHDPHLVANLLTKIRIIAMGYG